MTASPDPYDATFSAIRGSVEDLAVALAIWSYREEPDAQARRAASDAVDAVDAMLRDLHTVRQQFVSEIRTADDATAARADELLARREDGKG